MTGVQSGGGSRTPARLDREAARVVVRRFVSPYLVEEDEETVIAAFEGCVVQPAPQTIDRETLIAELGRFIQDDDAPDPLFSPDEVTAIAEYQAGRILALVQPVEGVLLTPEEAERVLSWWYVYREAGFPGMTDAALVERLEASS